MHSNRIATHPLKRVKEETCAFLNNDESVSVTSAQLCVGVVTSSESNVLSIQSGQLKAFGRRAASCLLEPTVGDTVACLRVAPNEVWVTSVLQREENTTNILRCDGPTRLEVSGGGFSVLAQDIRLESEIFCLKSGRAHLSADSTEVLGGQIRVVGSMVKMVGAVLSTVFDRVSHYSKYHLRTTEGMDRVHATHIEQEAKQLLRLSAEHALINGQKLVKARGAQIHFG
jgi:Protein of unknown function (DUF3540)